MIRWTDPRGAELDRIIAEQSERGRRNRMAGWEKLTPEQYEAELSRLRADYERWQAGLSPKQKAAWAAKISERRKARWHRIPEAQRNAQIARWLAGRDRAWAELPEDRKRELVAVRTAKIVAWSQARTPEERSEQSRQAMRKRWANATPEQRRAAGAAMLAGKRAKRTGRQG